LVSAESAVGQEGMPMRKLTGENLAADEFVSDV
jgi:hypothetical protein